jgi:hypothetical protein
MVVTSDITHKGQKYNFTDDLHDSLRMIGFERHDSCFINYLYSPQQNVGYAEKNKKLIKTHETINIYRRPVIKKSWPPSFINDVLETKEIGV